MSEQLALQPAALKTIENSPLALIQQAIDKGISGEHLNALMDFAERLQANQARKAYTAAFAAFKAEAVRIVKNVDVKLGPLAGKKYADLFGVTNTVIPILAKHGLSHSWKPTKDTPEWIEITCIITHEMGHSESVSLGGAPDIGPGRNAIQARASSVSYLERYTLLAATGLAACGEDTDGNPPKEPGGEMDESAIADWIAAIEGSGDKDELKKNFFDASKAASDAKDRNAMSTFQKVKNATWKKRGFVA
jgi:hypothetical protein